MRFLRENSLSVFFGVILIGSLVGQSFAGLHQFNADAVTHHQAAYTWWRYVTSSVFGGDVMENWQSEFLAVGTMAVFAVYLRQRGSPESKPVGAPHDATGESGYSGASATCEPFPSGTSFPTVKAVVLHETGGPEALVYEDAPDPEPRDGEVLLRVEAAGINHIDLTWRAGGPPKLPAILGVDAAGRREDTGERVLVTGTRGTYAELVAAKEENVFLIPDSLDAAPAAALSVPYKTAWWSLVDLGGLKEGQTLLVQGVGTATGQACADVGRMLGAKVYVTTRAEKLGKARALGMEALEYGDPRIRELEANVVFDPIGGETFSDSVEALAREGILLTPGTVGSPRVSFNVWTLLGRKARIQGIGAAQMSRQTMDVLIGMAASGKLRPVIDRELPLEQAAEAHRAIEARETFGKVILRP